MSLQLHKEKGLNPHMTYCPRCKGEGPEIMLLGAHNKVYVCSSCEMHHIGRPKKGACTQCSADVVFERELEDSERIPGSLCKDCEAQIKMVEEGGVFFKCKDCDAIGSIKGDHPLAIQARKQTGVAAPNPCGIEFDKNTCPVCTGQVGTDGT